MKYDLCVIGSGPAGIIVALEYSHLNPEKKVLLVEYGAKNDGVVNDLDNSIKISNSLNHHDPYECTNKGFGGTSATWGGRCVMYDEIDFTDRPIIERGCTWELSLFETVKAYLPRSAFYFECGDPGFNLSDIPQFRNKRIAENFKEGVVTDSVVERWSMPTRFGKRYLKTVAGQINLTLLEGYEAREFAHPDAQGTVSSLTIRKKGTSETCEIEASVFVIAAGAQESTRILLRNKQLFKNLPNVPNSLGRYYQGHLSGKIASVKFAGDPKKTEFGFLRDSDGTYIRRRFQFSNAFLKKNNLLNTAIWLDNPLYYDPKHKSGAMSFMYLAMLMPVLGKRLAPPAIAHSITKGKKTGIHKHFWNIVTGFPASLIKPAGIFYKRYCLKRKLPGVFLFSPYNSYALHFHSEQTPSEKNSMQLDSDGETLLIDYGLTDADISSVIKLHDVLDKWLQQCNCGKLEYWYPASDLAEEIRKMSKDGIHQSGTTRIADSPANGVVDKDLALWGTKNVYVCSSSVFPTSGQANPTFFLGAFAARLANHLSNNDETS
jgi:choline dehydrogenase-like flavoprotein